MILVVAFVWFIRPSNLLPLNHGSTRMWIIKEVQIQRFKRSSAKKNQSEAIQRGGLALASSQGHNTHCGHLQLERDPWDRE